jgi:hypothetical protein
MMTLQNKMDEHALKFRSQETLLLFWVHLVYAVLQFNILIQFDLKQTPWLSVAYNHRDKAVYNPQSNLYPF